MKNQAQCLKVLYSLTEIRNIPVFVVGGTIRDLLLGRDTADLDMLIFGDVWKVATDLSQAFESTWFILDEPSQTARVILPGEMSHKHLDLIGAGYQNLIENLLDRDFTINAMAVSLRDYLNYLEGTDTDLSAKIVDPAKGRHDLEMKIIRITGTEVFENDPLRLLRAIRFMATLEFQLEFQTRELIRGQAELISRVACERVRDELFKILALASAHQWIVELDELGLLSQVFPELPALKGVQQNEYHALDVWGHCLATMEEFCLKPWEKLLNSNNKILVDEYLSEDIVTGRQRGHLLKLAALLHDMGKPEVKGSKAGGKIIFYGHEQAGARQAKQISDRLKLSGREKHILSLVIDQHMRPFHLFRAKNHTDKAEYRFFVKAETEAISVLMLSLADRQAGRSAMVEEETSAYQAFIKKLTEKYYFEFEPARNQPIIGGREVMAAYGLKPGPSIGKIMLQVEEAQALGKIHTPEEALSLVGKILKSSRIFQ
jgi:poly(A) polymerase